MQVWFAQLPKTLVYTIVKKKGRYMSDLENTRKGRSGLNNGQTYVWFA